MGDRRLRLLPYRYYHATTAIIVVSLIAFFIASSDRSVLASLALQRAVLGERLWTPLTYLFVHAPGGLFSTHLLVNMLGLYWFGTPVERSVGSSEFLWLYLGAGVAAGLVAIAPAGATAVIGASCPVFAVMVVYATLFPDARIALFFFVPLRAPVAVLVFAAISVVFSLSGGLSGISHLAHLGGLVAGGLYSYLRLGRNPVDAFLRR